MPVPAVPNLQQTIRPKINRKVMALKAVNRILTLLMVATKITLLYGILAFKQIQVNQTPRPKGPQARDGDESLSITEMSCFDEM